MEATLPTIGSRRYRLIISGVLIVLSLGMVSISSLSAEEKRERLVEVAEPAQEDERPTLEDEDQGPQIKVEAFLEQREFESLQRQDEAIRYLRDLLQATPENNPQRAEFLFNLAEIYWERSKYYESEGYNKQDECYRYEDQGDPQRLRMCQLEMQDMQEESQRLRQDASQMYADIVRQYPNFDELDKVYFHLGTNMMEIGELERGMQIFRRLLADFPDTEYTPNIMQHFGDYYFENNDARQALAAYEKVIQYPNSPLYPYALYKAAWCHFNLVSKDKAIELFLQVIDTARARPHDPNSNSLVRQTRFDIVRTYAHVGAPDRALGFFKDIADNDEEIWMTMLERLAIHYADMGKLSESTHVYRQLISLNQQSVKTVDYQYEIVRNQTTINAYSTESIEEIVRVMKLIQLAREGQFADFRAQEFPKTEAKTEEMVRRWASIYHREAQKTRNPDLYRMGYFLYKHYMETFEKSEHLYMMTFFYGELLYQLEMWEEAAVAYDSAVRMSPDGEYSKDAIHATVLAYFRLIDTSEEQADIRGELPADEEGAGAPAPQAIPELHGRLIAACERYVNHLPDGDRLVDVKYTMARTYYDFDHLHQAAEIFRDVAFNHSDHRLAVTAANLHLDALNLARDFDALHAAAQDYVRLEPINDAQFKADVLILISSIGFKRCTLFDEQEKWRDAARCFMDFSRDYPDSDFVDKALYNAALDYERLREIGQAIDARIELLRVRPQSELAPQTLYNIGANFHALAVYSEAARFYESFVQNYPNHELAEAALANASTFRQGLGEFELAIKAYEQYLKHFGKANPEKAAEVFFQIAQIYEKQGKRRDAFNQYEMYLRRHARSGSTDRLLQAEVAMAMYYWERGGNTNRRRALAGFEQTLKTYHELSGQEQQELTLGRDAAAQAKFMIGEDIFEKMVAIKVDSPNEKVLQNRLRDKMKVAEKAQQIYEEVISFGRPDWAIAALFRIGAAFQSFADSIRNSPTPARLTYEQQEIYKGILEDQASRIEERAVSAYRQALATAREQNWFNEYSQQAEMQLAQLRPREFRRPSELRVEPKNFHHGVARVDVMAPAASMESDNGGRARALRQ